MIPITESIDVLLLSQEDVLSLDLTPREMVEVVEKASLEPAAGTCEMHSRIGVHPTGTNPPTAFHRGRNARRRVTIRARKMAKRIARIRFSATLFRPKGTGKVVSWTFLNLPTKASAKLPSRGMTSVEGTINGFPFRATLEPDGHGGHWLKVDQALREAAGAKVGESIKLDIAPVSVEPEPAVPVDLRKALAAAPRKAAKTWSDITPVARRDWIFWIISGKRAETRGKRIQVAVSKLSAGDRRPCCFDRSGMYSKSLGCPEAEGG
jgi:Domain of unknown function (DUF1905)/Bacteriocin-protection, YdeI or OmpD-Associated